MGSSRPRFATTVAAAYRAGGRSHDGDRRPGARKAGGAQARSTLLGSNVLVALAAPSGAQLWACIAEATDGQQPTSVGAMALAIERCCSTMAGALFASSLLS